MAIPKKRCSFKPQKGERCKHQVYKDSTLCKLHAKGKINANKKALSIYVGGLYKEEQDLYDDIVTGTLTHEIKIAKLQLRRLLIKQFNHNSSPEDVNKMIASEMNMDNVIIQNGKLITTSGLPVDMFSQFAEKIPLANGETQVIPAALIKSELRMKQVDHMADIERMLNIIMRLEKVHYDIMGGTGDDPDLIAKQIYEYLTQIEENANGLD